MSIGRKYNGLTPKQVDLLVPGIVKLYTERPVMIEIFPGSWGKKSQTKAKRERRIVHEMKSNEGQNIDPS